MKNEILAILKKSVEKAPIIHGLFYILKLSLLFGTTIVIAYLFHIRFLPFLNFEAIFSLAILCTVMGLMIATFSFLILIFAPYLWRQLLKNPSVFNWLVSDPMLYSKNYILDADFSASDRIKIMIGYILSMSIMLNILLALFYFNYKILFGIVCLSGLVGVLTSPIRLSGEKYIPIKKDSKTWFFKNEKIKILAKSVIQHLKTYFILSSATISLLVSIALVSELQEKDFFTRATLLGTEEIILFFVSISSFCVIPIKGNTYNLKNMAISCLMIFALIFPTLNLTDNYCGRIMQYFKVGNMYKTSLVINKDACIILSLGGYPIVCDKPYQIVKKINVLWRFGEYYVTYTINEKGNEIQKYSIIPSNNAWLNGTNND